MDILVTLKINDLAGNLLHKEEQMFSDDIGYTLDEIIKTYGEHVENYLLDRIDFNANDVGKVILRFHYLALSDEHEDKDEEDEEDEEDKDEEDEEDEEDEDEEDEATYIEYEDGVGMYDMSLTNERIVVRFGSIHEE